MKFKNVVVTGGAGFIGSHLVDALVKVSERVYVIDKNKPSVKKKNKKAVYKKIDIRDGDIESILKKEKPEIVFHLAAHIDDRESVHEPVMNAQHNLIGTLRLLEAVQKFGKSRVIFASTGGVIYGEQDELPVTEEAIAQPLTPYAVSKLTGERYLHFYHQVHGVPYTALRFGNVYGPGQDQSAECGAIAIFTARLLQGEQVFINNDGETTRDYVYIDDVVDALMKAAELNQVGIYNIGTGVETSTLQLFDLVRDAIGIQAAPDFREEVEDVIKRSALDSSKAKRDLNWEPSVTIVDGIEETVNWYRENV